MTTHTLKSALTKMAILEPQPNRPTLNSPSMLSPSLTLLAQRLTARTDDYVVIHTLDGQTVNATLVIDSDQTAHLENLHN